MTNINEVVETKRRPSFIRVLFVCVVIIGLIYSTTLSYQEWQANSFAGEFEPWFAAYVDVTSTLTYGFENPASNTELDAVLSFIVADSENVCTPTWGNYYSMEYGNSKDPNDSMYEASRKALVETHRQLGILYEQVAIPLHSSSIWKKIGATPMIGQNGSAG